MSTSASIVRNGAFVALGRLWTAGTTFFIMPYMLRVMGEDALGVWQMALRIVFFMGIAEVGVGAALIKYSAEYAAKKDHEAINKSLNSALVFYFILCSIVLLLGFVFTDTYLRFIRTPESLLPAARGAFHWVVAVTAIFVGTAPFRYTLQGLRRLDVISTIEVLVSVPILAATVWVLYRADTPGQALAGMGMVQFFQFAAICFAIAWYGVRLTPGYRFSLRSANWRSMRGLFGYGWKSSIASVCHLGQSQAEWFLLARLLGPGSVSLYSFGSKVVDVWKNAIQPAFVAVTGAASAMSVTEKPEAIRRLYERGTKLANIALHGMGVWLIAITPVFITAWMGAGYGRSMQAMRVLTLALIITLSAGVARSIGYGLGRLKSDVVASIVLVVTQISLGLLLGREHGFIGLLAATLIAFSLFSMVSITMILQTFEWPVIPTILRLYITPLVIATIAGLPVMWYNHLHRMDIIRMGVSDNRVLSLVGVGILETIAYFGLYALILWGTRYMTAADVLSIRHAARGARTVHRTPAPASVGSDG